MPTATAETISGHHFAGWRAGVLHFALWSSLVFLINLVALIWGSLASKPNHGAFFEGDCVRTKTLNSGIHVLINFLSTVLLSGSNYCMQVLSAPTRKEIDVAHGSSARTWLDIGVPGVRNLKHISRRRLLLWSLLALSSLPLHLFYNSAVYASLSSNSYYAFSVSQSFVDQELKTECPDPSNAVCRPLASMTLTTQQMRGVIPKILHTLKSKQRAGQLLRLEPSECLEKYAQTIQFERRNVLLVGNDKYFPAPDNTTFLTGTYVDKTAPPAVNATLWTGPHVFSTSYFSAKDIFGPETAANAYSWICGGSPVCSDDIDGIKNSPDTWKTGDWCEVEHVGDNYTAVTCGSKAWPVEYCLSEDGEPHCKLQFEISIAIMVTVLNAIKALLMFYVAFGIREDPILTVGDAVASFLQRNDISTRNMCLASGSDFKSKKDFNTGPKQWHVQAYRWKDVTSRRRRIITLVIFFMALVLVCALLIFGFRSLVTENPLSRLGYGAIDPRTSIGGLPDSSLANIVLANLPQVILSLLYVSYNALMTAMLMGYEWMSYSSKRKGLRVSKQPQGKQRSTYFLQLPYRFGIPLLVLSGTLHWMISQSIFLLAVDFYDAVGDVDVSSREGMPYVSGDYRTLGFSPAAIISVIALGSLMVISIIVMGYIPYRKGMPLAGSNSMAISAACHSTADDEDEDSETGPSSAFEKLQWGVIKLNQDGVGHCGFSSKPVTTPIEGEVYAGTEVRVGSIRRE